MFRSERGMLCVILRRYFRRRSDVVTKLIGSSSRDTQTTPPNQHDTEGKDDADESRANQRTTRQNAKRTNGAATSRNAPAKSSMVSPVIDSLVSTSSSGGCTFSSMIPAPDWSVAATSISTCRSTAGTTETSRQARSEVKCLRAEF